MTRRTMNVDGTISLKSFSYHGGGSAGDANEAFRQEIDKIEKLNCDARAKWEALPPEERERRIAEFEAKEKPEREAAEKSQAEQEERLRKARAVWDELTTEERKQKLAECRAENERSQLRIIVVDSEGERAYGSTPKDLEQQAIWSLSVKL